MREKHCAFSIFVFTATAAFLFGFFMLTTTQVFADNGYKGNDKHKEWQKERNKEYQKHQREIERENRKHYTVIRDINTTITAIGDLGSNEIDTRNDTRSYASMAHITVKIHI